MKKMIFHLLRGSWFMLGIFVMSMSVVLLVQAELGPMPWDVFHLGLQRYLPLTLGQVIIVTGIVVVTISWILGVKPYVGTVINTLLIGPFIDLIIYWNLFPEQQMLTYRIGYLVVGIVLCGLGGAMYMNANLGYGPRDSLMIALHRITGRRIGAVRTVIEVTVVAVGWLMGGLFGLGTVVFSLTIGWSTELFLNIFDKIKTADSFINFKSSMLGRHGDAPAAKACRHRA